MKINLHEIDRESFYVNDHQLGNETVYLVTPKQQGCEWNVNNVIFRSSMWDGDGLPVSLSFKKFANWGEKPTIFPVPENLDKCNLINKEDGCCDEDTILFTENGEKTIKEICEDKYTGKVLAYDIDNGVEIWSEVISHSIKTNNNDWYEIELENGNIVKLTGNHRIWLPELNCYRTVRDLTINDSFLLKK